MPEESRAYHPNGSRRAPHNSRSPIKEHAKLDPDELKARQQQRSREALLRLASEKAAERQRREERLNKLKELDAKARRIADASVARRSSPPPPTLAALLRTLGRGASATGRPAVPHPSASPIAARSTHHPASADTPHPRAALPAAAGVPVPASIGIASSLLTSSSPAVPPASTATADITHPNPLPGSASASQAPSLASSRGADVDAASGSATTANNTIGSAAASTSAKGSRRGRSHRRHWKPTQPWVGPCDDPDYKGPPWPDADPPAPPPVPPPPGRLRALWAAKRPSKPKQSLRQGAGAASAADTTAKLASRPSTSPSRVVGATRPASVSPVTRRRPNTVGAAPTTKPARPAVQAAAPPASTKEPASKIEVATTMMDSAVRGKGRPAAVTKPQQRRTTSESPSGKAVRQSASPMVALEVPVQAAGPAPAVPLPSLTMEARAGLAGAESCGPRSPPPPPPQQQQLVCQSRSPPPLPASVLLPPPPPLATPPPPLPPLPSVAPPARSPVKHQSSHPVASPSGSSVARSHPRAASSASASPPSGRPRPPTSNTAAVRLAVPLERARLPSPQVPRLWPAHAQGTSLSPTCGRTPSSRSPLARRPRVRRIAENEEAPAAEAATEARAAVNTEAGSAPDDGRLPPAYAEANKLVALDAYSASPSRRPHVRTSHPHKALGAAAVATMEVTPASAAGRAADIAAYALPASSVPGGDTLTAKATNGTRAPADLRAPPEDAGVVPGGGTGGTAAPVKRKHSKKSRTAIAATALASESAAVAAPTSHTSHRHRLAPPAVPAVRPTATTRKRSRQPPTATTTSAYARQPPPLPPPVHHTSGRASGGGKCAGLSAAAVRAAPGLAATSGRHRRAVRKCTGLVRRATDVVRTRGRSGHGRSGHGSGRDSATNRSSSTDTSGYDVASATTVDHRRTAGSSRDERVGTVRRRYSSGSSNSTSTTDGVSYRSNTTVNSCPTAASAASPSGDSTISSSTSPSSPTRRLRHRCTGGRASDASLEAPSSSLPLGYPVHSPHAHPARSSPTSPSITVGTAIEVAGAVPSPIANAAAVIPIEIAGRPTPAAAAVSLLEGPAPRLHTPPLSASALSDEAEALDAAAAALAATLPRTPVRVVRLGARPLMLGAATAIPPGSMDALAAPAAAGGHAGVCTEVPTAGLVALAARQAALPEVAAAGVPIEVAMRTPALAAPPGNGSLAQPVSLNKSMQCAAAPLPAPAAVPPSSRPAALQLGPSPTACHTLGPTPPPPTGWLASPRRPQLPPLSLVPARNSGALLPPSPRPPSPAGPVIVLPSPHGASVPPSPRPPSPSLPAAAAAATALVMGSLLPGAGAAARSMPLSPRAGAVATPAAASGHAGRQAVSISPRSPRSFVYEAAPPGWSRQPHALPTPTPPQPQPQDTAQGTKLAAAAPSLVASGAPLPAPPGIGMLLSHSPSSTAAADAVADITGVAAAHPAVAVGPPSHGIRARVPLSVLAAYRDKLLELLAQRHIVAAASIPTSSSTSAPVAVTAPATATPASAAGRVATPPDERPPTAPMAVRVAPAPVVVPPTESTDASATSTAAETPSSPAAPPRTLPVPASVIPPGGVPAPAIATPALTDAATAAAAAATAPQTPPPRPQLPPEAPRLATAEGTPSTAPPPSTPPHAPAAATPATAMHSAEAATSEGLAAAGPPMPESKVVRSEPPPPLSPPRPYIPPTPFNPPTTRPSPGTGSRPASEGGAPRANVAFKPASTGTTLTAAATTAAPAHTGPPCIASPPPLSPAAPTALPTSTTPVRSGAVPSALATFTASPAASTLSPPGTVSPTPPLPAAAPAAPPTLSAIPPEPALLSAETPSTLLALAPAPAPPSSPPAPAAAAQPSSLPSPAPAAHPSPTPDAAISAIISATVSSSASATCSAPAEFPMPEPSGAARSQVRPEVPRNAPIATPIAAHAPPTANEPAPDAIHAAKSHARDAASAVAVATTAAAAAAATLASSRPQEDQSIPPLPAPVDRPCAAAAPTAGRADAEASEDESESESALARQGDEMQKEVAQLLRDALGEDASASFLTSTYSAAPTAIPSTLTITTRSTSPAATARAASASPLVDAPRSPAPAAAVPPASPLPPSPHVALTHGRESPAVTEAFPAPRMPALLEQPPTALTSLRPTPPAPDLTATRSLPPSSPPRQPPYTPPTAPIFEGLPLSAVAVPAPAGGPEVSPSPPRPSFVHAPTPGLPDPEEADLLAALPPATATVPAASVQPVLPLSTGSYDTSPPHRLAQLTSPARGSLPTRTATMSPLSGPPPPPSGPRGFARTSPIPSVCGRGEANPPSSSPLPAPGLAMRVVEVPEPARNISEAVGEAAQLLRPLPQTLSPPLPPASRASHPGILAAAPTGSLSPPPAALREPGTTPHQSLLPFPISPPPGPSVTAGHLGLEVTLDESIVSRGSAGDGSAACVSDAPLVAVELPVDAPRPAVLSEITALPSARTPSTVTALVASRAPEEPHIAAAGPPTAQHSPPCPHPASPPAASPTSPEQSPASPTATPPSPGRTSLPRADAVAAPPPSAGVFATPARPTSPLRTISRVPPPPHPPTPPSPLVSSPGAISSSAFCDDDADATRDNSAASTGDTASPAVVASSPGDAEVARQVIPGRNFSDSGSRSSTEQEAAFVARLASARLLRLSPAVAAAFPATTTPVPATTPSTTPAPTATTTTTTAPISAATVTVPTTCAPLAPATVSPAMLLLPSPLRIPSAPVSAGSQAPTPAPPAPSAPLVCQLHSTLASPTAATATPTVAISTVTDALPAVAETRPAVAAPWAAQVAAATSPPSPVVAGTSLAPPAVSEAVPPSAASPYPLGPPPLLGSVPTVAQLSPAPPLPLILTSLSPPALPASATATSIANAAPTTGMASSARQTPEAGEQRTHVRFALDGLDSLGPRSAPRAEDEPASGRGTTTACMPAALPADEREARSTPAAAAASPPESARTSDVSLAEGVPALDKTAALVPLRPSQPQVLSPGSQALHEDFVASVHPADISLVSSTASPRAAAAAHGEPLTDRTVDVSLPDSHTGEDSHDSMDHGTRDGARSITGSTADLVADISLGDSDLDVAEPVAHAMPLPAEPHLAKPAAPPSSVQQAHPPAPPQVSQTPESTLAAPATPSAHRGESQSPPAAPDTRTTPPLLPDYSLSPVLRPLSPRREARISTRTATTVAACTTIPAPMAEKSGLCASPRGDEGQSAVAASTAVAVGPRTPVPPLRGLVAGATAAAAAFAAIPPPRPSPHLEQPQGAETERTLDVSLSADAAVISGAAIAGDRYEHAGGAAPSGVHVAGDGSLVPDYVAAAEPASARRPSACKVSPAPSPRSTAPDEAGVPALERSGDTTVDISCTAAEGRRSRVGDVDMVFALDSEPPAPPSPHAEAHGAVFPAVAAAASPGIVNTTVDVSLAAPAAAMTVTAACDVLMDVSLPAALPADTTVDTSLGAGECAPGTAADAVVEVSLVSARASAPAAATVATATPATEIDTTVDTSLTDERCSGAHVAGTGGDVEEADEVTEVSLPDITSLLGTKAQATSPTTAPVATTPIVPAAPAAATTSDAPTFVAVAAASVAATATATATTSAPTGFFQADETFDVSLPLSAGAEGDHGVALAAVEYPEGVSAADETLDVSLPSGAGEGGGHLGVIMSAAVERAEGAPAECCPTLEAPPVAHNASPAPPVVASAETAITVPTTSVATTTAGSPPVVYSSTAILVTTSSTVSCTSTFPSLSATSASTASSASTRVPASLRDPARWASLVASADPLGLGSLDDVDLTSPLLPPPPPPPPPLPATSSSASAPAEEERLLLGGPAEGIIDPARDMRPDDDVRDEEEEEDATAVDGSGRGGGAGAGGQVGGPGIEEVRGAHVAATAASLPGSHAPVLTAAASPAPLAASLASSASVSSVSTASARLPPVAVVPSALPVGSPPRRRALVDSDPDAVAATVRRLYAYAVRTFATAAPPPARSADEVTSTAGVFSPAATESDMIRIAQSEAPEDGELAALSDVVAALGLPDTTMCDPRVAPSPPQDCDGPCNDADRANAIASTINAASPAALVRRVWWLFPLHPSLEAGLAPEPPATMTAQSTPLLTPSAATAAAPPPLALGSLPPLAVSAVGTSVAVASAAAVSASKAASCEGSPAPSPAPAPVTPSLPPLPGISPPSPDPGSSPSGSVNHTGGGGARRHGRSQAAFDRALFAALNELTVGLRADLRAALAVAPLPEPLDSAAAAATAVIEVKPQHPASGDAGDAVTERPAQRQCHQRCRAKLSDQERDQLRDTMLLGLLDGDDAAGDEDATPAGQVGPLVRLRARLLMTSFARRPAPIHTELLARLLALLGPAPTLRAPPTPPDTILVATAAATPTAALTAAAEAVAAASAVEGATSSNGPDAALRGSAQAILDAEERAQWACARAGGSGGGCALGLGRLMRRRRFRRLLQRCRGEEGHAGTSSSCGRTSADEIDDEMNDIPERPGALWEDPGACESPAAAIDHYRMALARQAASLGAGTGTDVRTAGNTGRRDVDSDDDMAEVMALLDGGPSSRPKKKKKRTNKNKGAPPPTRQKSPQGSHACSRSATADDASLSTDDPPSDDPDRRRADEALLIALFDLACDAQRAVTYAAARHAGVAADGVDEEAIMALVEEWAHRAGVCARTLRPGLLARRDAALAEAAALTAGGAAPAAAQTAAAAAAAPTAPEARGPDNAVGADPAGTGIDTAAAAVTAERTDVVVRPGVDSDDSTSGGGGGGDGGGSGEEGNGSGSGCLHRDAGITDASQYHRHHHHARSHFGDNQSGDSNAGAASSTRTKSHRHHRCRDVEGPPRVRIDPDDPLLSLTPDRAAAAAARSPPGETASSLASETKSAGTVASTATGKALEPSSLVQQPPSAGASFRRVNRRLDISSSGSSDASGLSDGDDAEAAAAEADRRVLAAAAKRRERRRRGLPEDDNTGDDGVEERTGASRRGGGEEDARGAASLLTDAWSEQAPLGDDNAAALSARAASIPIAADSSPFDRSLPYSHPPPPAAAPDATVFDSAGSLSFVGCPADERWGLPPPRPARTSASAAAVPGTSLSDEEDMSATEDPTLVAGALDEGEADAPCGPKAKAGAAMDPPPDDSDPEMLAAAARSEQRIAQRRLELRRQRNLDRLLARTSSPPVGSSGTETPASTPAARFLFVGELVRGDVSAVPTASSGSASSTDDIGNPSTKVSAKAMEPSTQPATGTVAPASAVTPPSITQGDNNEAGIPEAELRGGAAFLYAGGAR